MAKYICPFCENWSTDHKGAFTRHINSHELDEEEPMDEIKELKEPTTLETLIEVIEEIELEEPLEEVLELEEVSDTLEEEKEEKDWICGCGHMKSQNCSCPNSDKKYFLEEK